MLRYYNKKAEIQRKKDELLEKEPTLDAVSVCTWNNGHAPASIMALNAGKHIWNEKPLAASYPEGKEIMALATKNL